MKTNSFYRIYKIVWMAVTFFVQVVWFEKRHPLWNEETEKAWDRLMKKQAVTYKNTAIALEGLLIKLGQFMSSRADLLPKVFIDELEGLVDEVPPLSWEEAKQTLEESWGRPHGEILSEISDQPVASASIGEVYRARLHEGTEVAVKIQRREIETIMRIDFKAVRIVTWMMKHLTPIGRKINLDGLFRELVKVTNAELDFRKELENGQFFREAYEGDPEIYIPEFYKDYSSTKVLVMEWVNGVRVSNRTFLQKHHLDSETLANTVIDCFLKQFLEFGKFHADPHPGNLLVQKDGTLVLIDFGMVSSIHRSDIGSMISLVQGLLFEDFGKVFTALEELGFLLPSANQKDMEHAIRSLLELYGDRAGKEIDKEMMEEILSEVTGLMRRQPIQMPSEFAFLGRAVSVLVGVLYRITPEIDFLESTRPALMKWMETHQSFRSSAYEYAKDWAKPLVQMPALVREYLQAPYRHIEWEQKKARAAFKHEAIMTGKRLAISAFLLCL
ncbi:MAG TPA: AarF/UbiB family protein, partial [Bacillales bacterium]|nr:AarF/UbiB family protein [Bacillales bacterium]